jgi:hypothetical protein
VELKENNMGTFKSEVDLASRTMGPKYFCSCIGNLKTLFKNQHFLACLIKEKGRINKVGV